MIRDPFGRCSFTCDEISELLYSDPELNISNFLTKDHQGLDKYCFGNHQLYAGFKEPRLFDPIEKFNSTEDFDKQNQSQWRMPDEYKNLDIARWVLGQCREEHELQRVAQELLLFQDRNLFELLRYLKYMVDTFRQNGIVWGVGRGSSTASYVLFLIGVHKIDSIYYQLDITEFLK